MKLNRSWLGIICCLERRLRWFPFNIFLHKILKSDLGDLHDHYWSYFTIILKGGYWETTENGRFWRGPGYGSKKGLRYT